MKNSLFRFALWFSGFVLVSCQSSAETFIVVSVVDLRSALLKAASNNSADEVYVLPGTYDFSYLIDPVVYRPVNVPQPENNRLAIIGSGIGTTIFEGSTNRLALSLSTGPNPSPDPNYNYDGSAEIHIEGITFRGIPRAPVGSGPVLVNTRYGKISFSQCEFVDNLNTALTCFTGDQPSGYAGDIEMTGCVIHRNSGGTYGLVSLGTVNGNIRVRDCVFSGNSYGTPLNLEATAGGTIDVRDSRFETNSAGNQDGGAIHGLLSSGGSITVARNTFAGNSSAGHGGAVYLLAGGGTFLVEANQFTNNQTSHSPSGCVETELRYTQSTPAGGRITIQKNAFLGNQGGALYAFSGYLYASSVNDAGVPIELIQNRFQDNSGGGLRCRTVFGKIRLLNNTVYRNIGPNYGAWIQVYDNQSPTELSNNILWGNRKTAEPTSERRDLEIDDDYRDFTMAWLPPPDGLGAVVTLSHNDFSALKVTVGDQLLEDHNLDQDPCLRPDGCPAPASSIIDAGNNDASGLPDKDLAGNDRVQDGNGDHKAVVDLGAFEAAPVMRPTLRLIHVQNGRCLFNWSPQANYDLQSSQTPLFSTIDQSYSIDSQDQEFEVVIDAAPARFFRLKVR